MRTIMTLTSLHGHRNLILQKIAQCFFLKNFKRRIFDVKIQCNPMSITNPQKFLIIITNYHTYRLHKSSI